MEPFTPEQCRVIGSLVEKEATVPDSYPLTLNALRAACNQSSNRDPVVSYDERTVMDALTSLKDRRVVRFVHPAHGDRVTKYRHVLDEVWGLDATELATLALLLLRGPQTPGELRARMERYPASGPDVFAALVSLARREDPLVTQLSRVPGQKEQRWAHLLAGEVLMPSPTARAPAPPTATVPNDDARLESLHEEMRELRRLVEHLYRVLDEDPPDWSGGFSQAST